MRSSKKYDFFNSGDQIGRICAVLCFAVRSSQELLYDKPAEAMPNQDQLALLQFSFREQPRQQVGRAVW
jgi:hypothetical protein